MVEFLAELVSKNSVNPPLLVIIALPARLALKNAVTPPLLRMVAVPAVFVLKKFVVPKLLVIVVIPGGVRIEDVKGVVVDHGADDRTCGTAIAQL